MKVGDLLKHTHTHKKPLTGYGFDPEEFHGQRSLAGYILWSHKESYTAEQLLGFPGGSDRKESACSTGDPALIPGSGRSPGEGNKEMATHSSILAWRIPWTEEPGGLQSMGSERFGHS